MKKDFKMLSLSEEKKLTNTELLKYYQTLREYLINTPHEGLSKGSLSICSLINPFVRISLNSLCGYDKDIKYETDIKGLNAIYAHTHQSKMDHVHFIASNPNHTILLNSVVLSEFYKKVLMINGVYFVDKKNKESKKLAKLEMMRLLLDGKSITMFPESAWNLSPNKLHLPFYYGIVDIAKKTGMPIVPVLQEYIYDNSKLDGIERIKGVQIRYGSPIFVKQTDSLDDKLDKYSEWIASTRWSLMETKGILSRKDISNEEYINFLKGCIRNLERAGIDINIEREGLLGAFDDFYLFNHINDVDFDEFGNLLPTQYVRKLEKISNNHLYK